VPRKTGKPFPRFECKADFKLEFVHSDICGPFPESKDGTHYNLVDVSHSDEIFGRYLIGYIGSFLGAQTYSVTVSLVAIGCYGLSSFLGEGEEVWYSDRPIVGGLSVCDVYFV
jgi:hypothetical protein